jgi:two-component system sensor histidine kinase KdpD
VDEESPQLVAGLGAFAAIVVAAALVPLRDWLGSTNAALILAIVVVVAATFGGRVAGIVTSIAAAASFDFFFTKPYLTLTIDKREDVIAAVLLLVMGVIVGELAMLRLRSRREALDHARGASRLEDVAAIVAAGADVDEVWPVVRQSLVDELQLQECRFEPAPFGTTLTSLGSRGRIDSKQLRYAPGGGFTLPSEGVAVPVSHGGQQLGRLILVPTPGHGTTAAQRRVAIGLADQLAVAANRSQPLHPLS